MQFTGIWLETKYMSHPVTLIPGDGIGPEVAELNSAPGANMGDKYAMFDAVHGSAPGIAGKGIANPTIQFMRKC